MRSQSVVLLEKVADGSIGAPLPDLPLVDPLLVAPHQVVVLARVVVVEVSHLWEIFDPSMALL